MLQIIDFSLQNVNTILYVATICQYNTGIVRYFAMYR